MNPESITSQNQQNELTWVDISRPALANNILQFKRLLRPETKLCACVKSNAYGHGLVKSARVFLECGADWLSVNALYEARQLRRAGISAPICILGYVPCASIAEALALDCRLVVYNYETINAIAKATQESGCPARLHIKVETGTNRQGIPPEELVDFAKYIKRFESMYLEGLSTHFADIEDTTDHSYAALQIQRFENAIGLLETQGIDIPIKHCANSAAAILFPQTHFQLIRPGIACYGMWPSKETYVSYVVERKNGFTLKSAFTWKACIAQIKNVVAGEYIGYGCSFKTSHATRLAIIPIGYYDGYDRGISNGYVLIRGQRAALRGRICMNIIMVDITDIPRVSVEDEVVLIGRSGDEIISTDDFARWSGTINYEVTTRINDRIPRMLVD
ncbi:MAG: alanine racemase [Deltaproteobacteria bacterium]|nr:alanine racemase [Deltaproteobacteria bacterium]